MKSILTLVVCGCVCLAADYSSHTELGAPTADPKVIRAFADDFLQRIKTQDWAQAWKGAAVADAYDVKQNPSGSGDLQWGNLPLESVWYARVECSGHSVGYLMWESSSPHRLLEFGIDADKPLVSDGTTCQGIEDVPNLQQFPVPGQTAPQVASGCVPTSAANVLGYWTRHGFSQWQPRKELAGLEQRSALELLAARLRNAMPVQECQDTQGYTDTRMPLTGASPADAMLAIIADARQHDVSVEVSKQPFSRALCKQEIQARHPMLLTCFVRLPSKPQLAWRHEVTGIGWTVVDGDFFVIVHDNFYPTQNANAARWLRADELSEIVTIAPGNASASASVSGD